MAISVALIVVITCVDLLAPAQIHLGPLLVVAPALTLSFAGPRVTALIGALAVAAQVVIAALRGGFTVNHQVQIAAIAVISLLIVVYSQEQRRRHRELARVRSVSEATQRVVLRPLPHRLGPLRVASLYMAAEDEAQIGGDLYAATRVEDCTRLIIGDVRGKGLTSISDASVLMGAFREAAHFSPGLVELADVLERSVCRHLAEHTTIAHAERGGAAERLAAEAELREHFITALLVDIPDEGNVAYMTNCGHPPPLLLPERGGVTTLSATQPAPPLGMCELPRGSSSSGTPDTFTFEDGDTLLLYTDGVIEARAPDGSFYPLAQRVGQWSGSGPEGLLHHLRRDLLDHVGGRLGDDAAMVVIRRSPALHPVQQLKRMVPVNGAHR
ncbi:PP2C family protein-serine/threonine phosphatase [Streptomyces sp. PSAA01]|uniref:PP2C family protein-serine/threonine phosphatase n=1 Tax=Streptomyces sp. PSAA01 TaxID=2912762 RepID=UPI001F218D33|nr:PP2C family protein-serine/threonine phosphatase [Streptomyces sp. PSAA01]MCG0286698.1 serine/threonine-protein phosphatase [Streptomyces sp. PSAA01]